MGSYYGKDGKRYDTWGQQHEADARYEQHLEQKKLLEEQNQLLSEQIKMNIKMEQEKQLREAQKEKLQLMQMEHEKEMRILKLFDDVGISKNAFDTYLSKSIFTDDYYSSTEKINVNIIYLEQLKTLLEAIEDPFFDMTKYFKDEKLLDLEKEISADCYAVDEEEQVAKRIEIEQLKRKKKNAIILPILPTIFFTVISGIMISNDSESLFVYFPMLIPIVASVFYVKARNKIDEIKFSLDKPKLDEKKYADKLKKLINDTDKEIQIAKKSLISMIEKPINDFNSFRFNHYNSDVEKLLMDIEFNVTILGLGFDYPSINKSNKIKDGTIEDYVTYFNDYKR